ncbi:SdpI family protein [Gryllotalpicola daejeonensis]|uniref:SdpI family protein n=1 Tax=Gryllotalpicola daejeonensis TaxID=993087 RepID=UPI0031DD6BD9
MNNSDALSGALIIAWVFAALLLLLAVAATLAGRGVIKRNPIIGIRIPSLFASDEAWARGHAAAARPSWIGFVVALLSALVGVFAPVVYWLTIAVFVVTTVWMFIAASRAAKAS